MTIMEETMTRLFVGSGPAVIARHKWLGAEEAVNWFGRLMVVHSLLKATFTMLFEGDVEITSDAPADSALEFLFAEFGCGQGPLS